MSADGGQGFGGKSNRLTQSAMVMRSCNIIYPLKNMEKMKPLALIYAGK